MIQVSEIEKTLIEVSAFPSRHTLSGGYEKACGWLWDKFVGFGYQPHLVRTPLPAGPRIPATMEVDQVVVEIPGETDEWVLMGAHLDSLNLAGPPAEVVAPGANDNGSGLAVMLETARLWAGQTGRCGVIFVGFAAEEQGLLGAKYIAAKHAEEGRKMRAVLTSDMVGSPANDRGERNTHEIRCFSADGASRELARWIEFVGRTSEFQVKLVNRHDRFGRGGDHTPFALQGFPAVRFTEVKENYGVQHSDRDTMANLDVNYVAQTARVNWEALSRVVQAGLTPSEVKIDLKQGHDTHLTWEGPDSVEVFIRDTRSSEWEEVRTVNGREVVVERINKDDHFFGVAAVGGVPVVAS